MTKSQRTQAIVLRRTNYGEADRILQLLTSEGRRAVIAKAVRREKSKLAGGIELFAVSDVVITEGKGDLGILTSAQLRHYYSHIVEDYDRLQWGYTVIKLVAKASETVDEPEWFELLRESFAGLDSVSIPLPLLEAWFYLRYATLLGHALNLERDIDGALLASDLAYRYDIAEQGFRAVEGGDVTASHLKLLRLLASRPLQVLVQIGGVADVLPLCAHVARLHAAEN